MTDQPEELGGRLVAAGGHQEAVVAGHPDPHPDIILFLLAFLLLALLLLSPLLLLLTLKYLVTATISLSIGCRLLYFHDTKLSLITCRTRSRQGRPAPGPPAAWPAGGSGPGTQHGRTGYPPCP